MSTEGLPQPQHTYMVWARAEAGPVVAYRPEIVEAIGLCEAARKHLLGRITIVALDDAATASGQASVAYEVTIARADGSSISRERVVHSLSSSPLGHGEVHHAAATKEPTS